MRALLLAAGLGTRLQPLTRDIPKCLIPIDGRPLLEYWFAMLSAAGVSPLLVNIHHHSDKVRQFIDRSPYGRIVTTVYEEKLLGTGGTLLKNREFFGSEPLMLVHADNLSLFDVQSFIESHRGRPPECEITMMTFHSPNPEACGIIEKDARGCVRAFHEKVSHPPGNLANGAVYILEPSIFACLESLGKEYIDFSTEIIPRYLGRIWVFHNDVYHRDIGNPESYVAACREFPQWRKKYGAARVLS